MASTPGIGDSPSIALAVAERLRAMPHQGSARAAAEVYDALDLASGRDAALRPPAILVAPHRDVSSENRTPVIGALQRLTAFVQVGLIVTVVNNPRGGDGLESLRQLRVYVGGALNGWIPSGMSEAMSFATGGLVELANGRAWWRDEYRIAGWLSTAD